MLKAITPADRLDMLAERIERTAAFDMKVPAICAFGHCCALFGATHIFGEGERPSEYLARVLGIDPITARNLFYGYAPGAAYDPDRFGPLRLRSEVAECLRFLAARQRQRVPA